MSRIHIVLPPAAEAPPPARLPEFLTDLRPAAGDPYLALAKAADLAGLAGVVVPHDPGGFEPLVTAAALLRATRYVTVFAEIQPWIATPQYTAKLSASLQRFSGGRFGWYVGDDAESAAFVGTARDFWSRADGLPEVLSKHPFPEVAVAGTGIAKTFVQVGHDPGEIYRIGEHVIPLSLSEGEPVHVG